MFDLIADIIEYLLGNNITRILEEYNGASSDYIDNCKMTFVYGLSLNPKKQFSFSDINNVEYVMKIRSYFESLVSNHDYFAAVCLLEILDFMVHDYCEYIKKLDDGDIVNYEKLNEKNSQIELYPKCMCLWEHKNMGRSFRYDLRDHLKNLYFINLKDIPKGFVVNNYFVSQKLFLNAKYRHELRVGVAPLTNKNVFPPEMLDFSIGERICTFSVRGVSYAEELLQNVESIINLAICKEVDILVFPEMLGTKEINKCISNYVDKVDKYLPSIIVAPSVWKNHSNVATVFLGSDSSDAVNQFKNFKFPLDFQGNTYIEDLKFDNNGNHINLFHCEGIGVFVIAICKDLLIKEHIDFLIETLKTTLIISPSFSKGEYPFELTLQQGLQYDCSIIWINSCAAKHFRDNPETFSKKISMCTHKGISKCFDTSSECDGKCGACIYIYPLDFGG